MLPSLRAWYNDCTYVQSSPDTGLLRYAEIIPESHGLESKWRCAPLPFLRTWYNIQVKCLTEERDYGQTENRGMADGKKYAPDHGR